MKKTKAKRISIILIIFILLITFSAILYATGEIIINPTNLEFADENLYNSIKKKFSSDKTPYNSNDVTQTIEVSQNAVEAITELSLQGTDGKQIADLTGVDSFTNLQKLDLSGNAITNMSSISNLTKLTTLNISGNVINDNITTVISGLTNLTELNLTSTQVSDISFITNLSNLQNLVLSNNNISNLQPIADLVNITKLDVSKNTSFTSISQITSTLAGLIELNISGTGISELTGIDDIRGLEKLYAADNARIITTAGVSALYNTYKEENQTLMCLGNLKLLDLSNIGTTGKKPISMSSIAKLTSLEELRLASNELTSVSGIEKLVNLKAIDLSNNKLTSDGIKYLATLNATKIDLRKNQIIKVDIFADYPVDITYLDLSENHIYDISPLTGHSFSELLSLKKQSIIFGVFKKKIDANQYIILPSILTQSQVEGSIVYAGNTDNSLQFSGITLNPDYTDPNQYNVIIDSSKTSADKDLQVTLKGGNADGTVLTFQIGSYSGAHNGCMIDSALFKDENLEKAVYNSLTTEPDYVSKIKYLVKIPRILNANSELIAAVDEFNFQHTEANEDTKIKDLTGLENFYNLVTLQLQNNNIETINPLEACTRIQTLLLGNNPNLGNNNSAIEKMTVLSNLDLSNTGMTNIDSINNLTNSLKTKKMTILNISSNGLANIDGIENITTLQKLYISNEKLKDENIQVLETLTNLTTLNMSGNQIENIDVLSGLSNLQYLYFSENKVESIEPINGKVFYELEFSGNKIKDITPLSAHGTINRLIMNNNQIEDTTVLSSISMTSEQVLSVAGQKIIRTLDENATGSISIELPQIFKAAQDSNNKLYTSSELITANCSLDSTGNYVIVNVDELNGNVAQVEIYGGKATGTTLTIAPPLEGNITYEPSNAVKTNQNITATITFNRSKVTITNNEGKNTYTFENNGEFTFEYVDEYGFEGKATAVVNNIDREAPVATVKKEVKNKQVIVTITVNEKVVDIDGWTSTELTDGKMQLTKTYSADANENLNLVDEAGNSTPVSFQVKIDKTAPAITGVENGKSYNGTVTPVIQDENEYTVTLTKDGVAVVNYKSGDTIKEAGQYVLTVTDIFDNTTIVSFEIAISDVITPKDDSTVTVVEDETTVKNISPKTTVSALKQKLNSEMEYTIVDKNGTKISDTSNVGTGCKIKMESGKTYTLIVKGDCGGDGQAELKDILAINKHRLNKTKLTAEYLQAADVTGDGKVDLKDILQINKFRLGKTNEL